MLLYDCSAANAPGLAKAIRRNAKPQRCPPAAVAAAYWGNAATSWPPVARPGCGARTLVRPPGRPAHRRDCRRPRSRIECRRPANGATVPATSSVGCKAQDRTACPGERSRLAPRAERGLFLRFRLLRCIIFSSRESGAGQSATPQHVRVGDSFRRKRASWPLGCRA